MPNEQNKLTPTPSTSKKSDVCPICKQVVLDMTPGVKCDGKCKAWFHWSCLGYDVSIYDSFRAVGGLILWLCDADKRKMAKWLKDACNCKNEAVIEKGFKSLHEKMNNLELTMNKKIDENTAVNKDMLVHANSKPTQKLTYAEVMKSPYSDEGNKKVSFNMANTSKIIIKPKSKEAVSKTSIETENIFKTNIKPIENKMNILRIIHVKNGGILVKTHSDKSDRLLELIKEKMSDFETYRLDPRKPRIILKHIKREYMEDELIQELIELNQSINKDDVLELKYKKKLEKSFMYVLELSPKTFRKLMEKKYVNLDYNTIKVEEHIAVLRCAKCQQYGHFYATCQNKKICAKCSEEHDTKTCKSKKEMCGNCKDLKTGQKNHGANSRDCPYYLKMLNIAREKISYE